MSDIKPDSDEPPTNHLSATDKMTLDGDHKIQFESIPTELKEYDQWICWEQDEVEGRKVKKLYSPCENVVAISKPIGWSSYDEAHKLAMGHLDGLGFVFSERDPFVGIDIENCISPNGAVDERAREIIDTVGSYAEISASGTGVHIIAKGSVPVDHKRYEEAKVYSTERFFTLTGWQVEGTSNTIERRPRAVKSVYEEHIGEDTSDTEISVVEPRYLTDEEVIEEARYARGRSGPKFSSLWNGHWRMWYDTRERAEWALCYYLARYTGGDQKRIERLFWESDLMDGREDKHDDHLVENVLSEVDDFHTLKLECRFLPSTSGGAGDQASLTQYTSSENSE